jgi:hypothetical protein
MKSSGRASPRPIEPANAKAVHRSIELLMRGSEAATPEDVIRSRAQELVARAKALTWSGPPFDMRQLASILGIRDRVVLGLQQDALIMPHNDGRGFEIRWNATVAETRRNFTFGHEIAHTFFPDCATEIQHRRRLHRCDPKSTAPRSFLDKKIGRAP